MKAVIAVLVLALYGGLALFVIDQWQTPTPGKYEQHAWLTERAKEQTERAMELWCEQHPYDSEWC